MYPVGVSNSAAAIDVLSRNMEVPKSCVQKFNNILYFEASYSNSCGDGS
jgi:hypothetical protein